MRGVLDRLISPSQNAFVPGRSIGDNILLAQKLFHSYNQSHLPPRCVLKVDLRKAYDTVEWDFLRAVLTLFGGTGVEECVTTPSYSVCLNGSPHGFFRGALGLRQGDPMSPYLFMLVMEVLTLIIHQFIDQDGGFSYHWRCDEVQLFQLGFADDLLLLSRADTSSIRIFQRGLAVFNDLSGLHVNPQKSHLILSRSGRLIGKCFFLLWDFPRDNFLSGIWAYHCWPPALQVYWAMAFILPKTVIREIEKRLRSFLWKGCTSVGYAKVSWQQAFVEGHVGRSLFHLGGLDNPYRLRGASIWTVSDQSGSWGWRKLVRLRVHMRSFTTYRIGPGSSFSLWHDPWHDLGPLILRFPSGSQHSSTSSTALLSTVIQDGSWHWPPITNMESIDITHCLPAIHGGQDRILWTGPGASFSSAAAYTIFHPPGPKVDWSSLLVGSLKIPRHRFILWLALLGRLSMLDKPWLQHLGTDCILCRATMPETHSHLFFLCPFAADCLREIRATVIFNWPYSSWDTTIQWAAARWRGKHVVNASYKALLASIVYHIWEERNRRIFQQTVRTPVIIARIIISEIRDLILCKQMVNSISKRGLYRLWRIPWPVEGMHASDPVVVPLYLFNAIYHYRKKV
ncbi:UNVERIFIED_CONTAM: LINE-1 retrotransposable element O protein [Sesamum latifolium]|uniref:LINE-1 retrotransposable element O protein n=1 Tax=Sesamum latifolium TaxID=2727402 RepID=A0AAW2VYF6_9LAMI